MYLASRHFAFYALSFPVDEEELAYLTSRKQSQKVIRVLRIQPDPVSCLNDNSRYKQEEHEETVAKLATFVRSDIFLFNWLTAFDESIHVKEKLYFGAFDACTGLRVDLFARFVI